MTRGQRSGLGGAMAAVQAVLVGSALLAFQGGQFPPLGTGVSADERAALQVQVDQLSSRIADLKRQYVTGPLADRIADVEVYLDAVRRPLKYDERLYAGRDSTPFAVALQTLATGNERAAQLMSGQSPWMTESGVRGFYSRIDGSAQPYILTMPEDYDAAEAAVPPRHLHARPRRHRPRTAVHGEVDDRLRVEAVWSRGRSLHAATVRPLQQRQPLRRRESTGSRRSSLSRGPIRSIATGS